jgi:hypothetical protein
MVELDISYMNLSFSINETSVHVYIYIYIYRGTLIRMGLLGLYPLNPCNILWNVMVYMCSHGNDSISRVLKMNNGCASELTYIH